MTTYIDRLKWLSNIGDPQLKAWWNDVSIGLREMASTEYEDLELKYTDTGFLSLRYRGVGLSNSVTEPGARGANRTHTFSLGYEQNHTTVGNQAKKYRKVFVPIIEEWIKGKKSQGIGNVTGGKDSRYLEWRVNDSPLPNPEKVLDDVRDFINGLAPLKVA